MDSRPRLSDELRACLPTPWFRLPELENGGSELWLKDDGRTGTSYGGNKLRKLSPLFASARAAGKRRIVTVGAAGSHHVLATTIYGQREGFDVTALVLPQLATPHVADNLRAGVGLGLQVIPATSGFVAVRIAQSLLNRDDAWIGPGGMGTEGANGFADAVSELELQTGTEGFPGALTLAVGSGSTAAGLLVGLVERELRCTLVGISVNNNPAVRPMVLAQAHALACKRAALRGARVERRKLWAQLSQRFRVDTRFVAGGYGKPSAASHHAIEAARAAGLDLEHTYTAKAFAGALQLVSQGEFPRVGFWNTLTASSLETFLADAPELSQLDPAIRRLLVRDSSAIKSAQV